MKKLTTNKLTVPKTQKTPLKEIKNAAAKKIVRYIYTEADLGEGILCQDSFHTQIKQVNLKPQDFGLYAFQ
jgi:hypothetical protein